MPLRFAKGVMKDARIGKQISGERANYGITVPEISTLDPEADSSWVPISPVCLLRLVAAEKRSNFSRRREPHRSGSEQAER